MSILRTFASSLVLGLVLTAFSSVASADVVFGNLGTSGTATAGNSGLFDPYVAQSFNTGSATFGKRTLESVTVGLFGPANVASLSLYSDSGSAPGSLLLTSTGKSLVSGNLFSFAFDTTAANAKLAGGTTYWVVMAPTDVNSGWRYVTPGGTLATGQNGWGYANNPGTGTTVLASLNGTSWSAAGIPNDLSISITAVPEPSTYAMAGIGACLFGLIKARRKFLRS